MYRKLLISALPVLVIGGFVGWLVVSSQKEASVEKTGGQEEAKPLLQEVIPVPSPVPQKVEASDNATVKEAEPALTENPPLPPPQEQFPSPEELSDSPLWKQLLEGDFCIRFITFLDEATMGFLPTKSLGTFKSKLPFTAYEENGEWFLTHETEARYAPFVELFCDLDAELAGKVYRGMQPALQNALKVCGYADRTPKQMLLSAMEKLRQVPLYESNPPMNKVADGLFVWKYKELEALSPIQKSILRMGQGNLLRIREKAERLIVEIGE